MSCPLRYATKRQLEPNISSYPVAREVIAQAVENTWQRALRVSRGEMTLEALEKANLDLVIWLQETFTGANPHFSCESEFNGRRLAELMRDNMRSEIETPRLILAMMNRSCFPFLPILSQRYLLS